jgi:hypothetical protein
VAKVVARCGIDGEAFRPKIGELITQLETNPKQYPKKKGPINGVIFSDGITWRMTFTLDEDARLAFPSHPTYAARAAPHDLERGRIDLGQLVTVPHADEDVLRHRKKYSNYMQLLGPHFVVTNVRSIRQGPRRPACRGNA